MAHLGKRRANETDLDDFSVPLSKKAHVSSNFSSAAAADQQRQQLPQSPGQLGPQFAQQGAFNPASDFGTLNPPAGSGTTTAGFQPQLQSGVGTDVHPSGALPAPSAAPVHCRDLVLYQPHQQPGASPFSSVGPPAVVLQRPLPQHLQPPVSSISHLKPDDPQQLLDTGHNDNAALKSVWRTLTPAQRRSLAGMWDVIKQEELLPRLVPSSGLLTLPSLDLDDQQQLQQQGKQPHCIIEEVNDEDADQSDKQQQQQQQGAANGFVVPVRNGFISPAEAPAADDALMMQVDGQQPDGTTRQPSVVDMEM